MQVAESHTEIIRTIDASHAGRVFTTGRKVRLTIVSVAFLGLMFAGVAAMGEGLLNLGGEKLLVDLDTDAAVALLVVGGLVFAIGAVVCLYAQHWFFLRSYERLMRRVIAERNDALVTPNDPESWFVKWTPRHQWHEVMLDDAADVGLLAVDRRNRLLVFEGDLFRHVVPLEGVTDCFTEFAGGAWEPFTVVVVRVEAAEPLELCYEHGQLRGPLSRWTCARRAEALADRIRDAAGRR